MADRQTCPGCGMSPDRWRGNDGEGVDKDGERYCCQGCADRGASGCTCNQPPAAIPPSP
jgi:hypothetical protein